MVVRFSDYKQEEYRELEAMVLALYQEDSDGESMDIKKIQDTVHTLTDNPERGRILFIKNGDAIIGYSILVFCWNTEFGGNLVIIDDLYLRPDFRNRGIATSFFEYLSDEYKGKAVALMLEASPSNHSAQRLYNRNGFKPAHSIHMMKII